MSGGGGPIHPTNEVTHLHIGAGVPVLRAVCSEPACVVNLSRMLWDIAEVQSVSVGPSCPPPIPCKAHHRSATSSITSPTRRGKK